MGGGERNLNLKRQLEVTDMLGNPQLRLLLTGSEQKETALELLSVRRVSNFSVGESCQNIFLGAYFWMEIKGGYAECRCSREGFLMLAGLFPVG